VIRVRCHSALYSDGGSRRFSGLDVIQEPHNLQMDKHQKQRSAVVSNVFGDLNPGGDDPTITFL